MLHFLQAKKAVMVWYINYHKTDKREGQVGVDRRRRVRPESPVVFAAPHWCSALVLPFCTSFWTVPEADLWVMGRCKLGSHP